MNSGQAALADLDQFATGLTKLMETEQGNAEAMTLYETLQLLKDDPKRFTLMKHQEQKVVLRMAEMYLLERMANVVARNK